MFFYVSFLRPPPIQSTLSGAISVTLQIANDLRTERFDGSEDIYYSWSQVVSPTTNQSTTIVTRPAKLTTWRQANAYKEIPVPLPKNLKEGQSWRLVLTARHPLSSPRLPPIELHNSGIGGIAFPVLSAPIQFGSSIPEKPRKQEQIERVYEIRPPVQDVESVALRLIEQTSFDLDKKIWDSGIGLSSWLVSLHNTLPPELSPLMTLKNNLLGTGSKNVIELGTGIGIVSLTIAALREIGGNSSEDGTQRIIATDLDSAMPILEHNITVNKPYFLRNHIKATVLNWEDPLPVFTGAFFTGFDIIVMADVTYNTSSFPALIRTLSDLIKLGPNPPLVLLAYKERDPSERILWTLAEEIGLHLSKLDECRGAGGAPVEIWLGTVVSVSPP